MICGAIFLFSRRVMFIVFCNNCNELVEGQVIYSDFDEIGYEKSETIIIKIRCADCCTIIHSENKLIIT